MFLIKRGKKAQDEGPFSTLVKIILIVVIAIILFLIIRRIGNAFTP